MTHARQQLREQVELALSSLGYPVTSNRRQVSQDDGIDTPHVSIETLNESIEYETGYMAQTPMRIVELSIVIVAKESEPADKLDTIAESVESAIYAYSPLIALAQYINLSDTTIELTDEHDQPAGRLTQVFEIGYLAAEGAAGTII